MPDYKRAEGTRFCQSFSRVLGKMHGDSIHQELIVEEILCYILDSLLKIKQTNTRSFFDLSQRKSHMDMFL
jgi:hypothetical protein